MGRRMSQIASITPQQEPMRCWPMTKVTSRWLLMLVWNWKRTQFSLCRAQWRKTAEGYLMQVHHQLMPVRNSQIQHFQGHAGKWKRQPMDHITSERVCRKLSLWLGTEASFHSGCHEDPRSQCRSWQRLGEVKETFSLGRKESKIQGRSYPSSAGRWKNSPFREGDNVLDEEGYTAVFTEQGASASQTAEAKYLDTISKLLGIAGETHDAVSANNQVEMTEAPRLSRLPKAECPKIRIRIPPRRRSTSWDNIGDPVVLLDRDLSGQPLAALLQERKYQAVILENGWEGVPCACLYMHKKIGLFLSVIVDVIKMVWKTTEHDTHAENSAKEIDLEHLTPLIDQVYLGCTQREAKVDLQAVQSETELFKKVNNDKGGWRRRPNERTYSLEKFAAWSCDMEGHAEKFVEVHCAWAKKEVSLQQVWTPCMDNQQIPLEDYETIGELSAVCARIVLKCLYLTRSGRSDTMVTKYSGKISNIMEQSFWQKVAKIDQHTSSKPNTTCNSVMWGIRWKIVSLVYYSTLHLQGSLRDSKSTSGRLNSCAFWEHTRLFLFRGRASSNPQFLTAVQSPK